MSKNKAYVLYDASGRIIAKMIGTSRPLASGNMLVVDDTDFNPDIMYVADGELVMKKDFDYLNNYTTTGNLILENVPVGTIIYWDDDEYEIPDGVIDIDIDQVGSFRLSLTHPQYNDKEIIIENN